MWINAGSIHAQRLIRTATSSAFLHPTILVNWTIRIFKSSFLRCCFSFEWSLVKSYAWLSKISCLERSWKLRMTFFCAFYLLRGGFAMKNGCYQSESNYRRPLSLVRNEHAQVGRRSDGGYNILQWYFHCERKGEQGLRSDWKIHGCRLREARFWHFRLVNQLDMISETRFGWRRKTRDDRAVRV